MLLTLGRHRHASDAKGPPAAACKGGSCQALGPRGGLRRATRGDRPRSADRGHPAAMPLRMARWGAGQGGSSGPAAPRSHEGGDGRARTAHVPQLDCGVPGPRGSQKLGVRQEQRGCDAVMCGALRRGAAATGGRRLGVTGNAVRLLHGHAEEAGPLGGWGKSNECDIPGQAVAAQWKDPCTRTHMQLPHWGEDAPLKHIGPGSGGPHVPQHHGPVT